MCLACRLLQKEETQLLSAPLERRPAELGAGRELREVSFWAGLEGRAESSACPGAAWSSGPSSWNESQGPGTEAGVGLTDSGQAWTHEAGLQACVRLVYAPSPPLLPGRDPEHSQVMGPK